MILMSPRESYLWLKALWDHHRSSRLSRPELERGQLRRFRWLVSHAHQHSPYYRRLIESRGIDPESCVPTDFPVLTKEEVIRHFDDLVTDRRITRAKIAAFLDRSVDPRELFEGRYHVLHTSGTSGTVGYFVFSHDAWIRGASHVVRASPLRGRRRTAFVAATRGHFAGASLMLTGNHGTNRLFFDVRTFDVGRPMPNIIRELNEFQPHVLSGYGTVLKVLAEAQERGELRIRPAHVGNGGEALLPEIRATLERAFGVPVMNAYASSEHLYMAMTLAGREGMHLMEDELIFEIKPDHTCITNLFNETMPLIRYRMDDVLVPEPDAEDGFPLRRIREIVGRREDSLVFTNRHGEDDFIHPIVIVELMIAGLNAWQIVLQDRLSFRFRARLQPHLSQAEREATFASIQRRMREILDEKEMTDVTFEIEEVDSLPIDPKTGKFRLVVREADANKSGASGAYAEVAAAV